MNSFFEGHIWPLRGTLFRMAFLWVKDRALAEDLLQNVFEKSFQREDELEKHPNLKAWMIRSLKNEALMHFRKNGRIISLEGEIEPSEEPKELEKGNEQLSDLMRLVAKLPEKQSQIFQLRESEGLTYEEIAEYLEISIEQVKVNLHRARKKLREEYLKVKKP
ncbi:MAG: RNA polymerase sigma factor [Cyclobacteriaceae bacterium]|jgi:RNA polymerase sigma-70 factor (ECF subfamily)|uniref:RNA polymerase sigma factor n=1 Tax=Algoriphagus marincola TaxID=264027 RepID=UPI00041B880B|nr:RNA polymerase sigma factor [Algoriphagus marincola]MCR9083902.1 RNA polymerase sigma factor [Cyclobacteriaceae bacterium]